MEQNNINHEHKFRLNIKQNTKLEKYWDLTCRADTIEELTVNIQKLKVLAMEQCGQPVSEEDRPKLTTE